MTKRLKVSEIVTDAGTQVRAGLNEMTVADYAEALADGAKFPPVVVFHDGKRHLAADGFHRITAARRIGAKEIECDIRRGGKLEALRFALGCNANHGLRRTNADKRCAVSMALKEFPKFSTVAIAEMCLVGDELVAEIRKSQVVENQRREVGQPTDSGRLNIPPVPQSRVGLDGRERRLPPAPMVRRETNRTDGTDGTPAPAGKMPAATAAGGDARATNTAGKDAGATNTGETHCATNAGGTRGATRLPPPPSQVLDATGWPIPTQLIPLWQRVGEVQEILTRLSRVKGTLRTAQDSKDVLYSGISFGAIQAHLDQAWEAIKDAKPFCVCPTCQGQIPDKCTLCRGRGLLSEFRWNTCVTREDKEFRFKAKGKR